jgi:hypothetical protein
LQEICNLSRNPWIYKSIINIFHKIKFSFAQEISTFSEIWDEKMVRFRKSRIDCGKTGRKYVGKSKRRKDGGNFREIRPEEAISKVFVLFKFQNGSPAQCKSSPAPPTPNSIYSNALPTL